MVSENSWVIWVITETQNARCILNEMYRKLTLDVEGQVTKKEISIIGLS